ncbi:conjugal transfer protein TraB [Pseudomonas aeruginosa]
MSADNDQKKNVITKQRGLYIVAAVGALGVAMNFMGGNSETTGATSVDAPKAVEVGSDKVNSITIQDKDAALTQFAKKIETLEDKIKRGEEDREALKAKMLEDQRKAEQKSNTEIRALSEEVAQLRKDQVDGVYGGINKLDKGSSMPLPPSSSEGLNLEDFSLEPPMPAVSANPSNSNRYGPNYFLLNGGDAGGQQFNGKSGGGAGSTAETEQQLFANMTAPETNGIQRAGVNTYNETDATLAKLNGRQPNPDPMPAAQSLNASLPTQIQRETYEVPAFSFVEVTTLHGVACPIGANAPGASEEGKIPARPVVLPVRGIFKGPNGAERDLGTIHLMGLCSGNRNSSSNTGRATIRIEQLSYWDETGGAQTVPATGYIVDTRDNEQDVYGRLDKASGRTLALQSAAAAAAAYASTLSQAEFTTNSAMENGTSSTTSQLTGSATKAAVNEGIAGMFKKISERFEREANAAVDTVIVEPGIKLRFVTDQTFRVLKPAEAFDIDPGMYDTLI